MAREDPEAVGRPVHRGAAARVARIRVGEKRVVTWAEKAAVRSRRVGRCACHRLGEGATGVPAPPVWRAVRQNGWRDGALPGASPRASPPANPLRIRSESAPERIKERISGADSGLGRHTGHGHHGRPASSAPRRAAVRRGHPAPARATFPIALPDGPALARAPPRLDPRVDTSPPEIRITRPVREYGDPLVVPYEPDRQSSFL
jgi:hypothetical protein